MSIIDNIDRAKREIIRFGGTPRYVYMSHLTFDKLRAEVKDGIGFVSKTQEADCVCGLKIETSGYWDGDTIVVSCDPIR